MLPVRPAARPHARDVASLTSMRFFAAAWVLALHYSMQMPVDTVSWTGFFVNGGMGVDFFFVLSGFILTHVYLPSLRTGTFDFRRFVHKRLARLYPLHFVCFLLVLGYVTAGRLMGMSFQDPQVYSWETLWPNLLLLHAWGVLDSMSWNYVSWSISAEWFAYLLFLPLGAVFLRLPCGPLARLALAIAFFALLDRLAPVLVGRELTHLTHDFGILRVLPEFMIGIALYHVSRAWDLEPAAGAWVTGAAVAAVLMVAHFDLGGFWAVLAFCVVIHGAASLERQGRVRWLRHRALVYLGEISYSLYMTHAIVFIVYFKALRLLLGPSYPEWVWYLGPAALLGAMILASIGYHVVEVPARRWLTGAGAASARRPDAPDPATERPETVSDETHDSTARTDERAPASGLA